MYQTDIFIFQQHLSYIMNDVHTLQKKMFVVETDNKCFHFNKDMILHISDIHCGIRKIILLPFSVVVASTIFFLITCVTTSK